MSDLRPPHLLALLTVLLLGACRPSEAPLRDVPAPDPSGLPARSAARLTDLLTQSQATSASTADRENLSADTFLELGHACLARGFADCAIAAYGNATTLNPTQPEPWLFHAHALLSGGQPGPAAGSIERALALDPSDLVAQLRRAEALAEADEGSRAAAAFAELLARPDLPPAIEAASRAGRAQLTLEEDPSAALADLDRALELSPSANILQSQRAAALRRLGRGEEADVALARAGTRSVGVADPRARTISRERVLAAFDSLIDLASAPAGADPTVLLGFADAQFGEVDTAVLELEKFLEAVGPLEPAVESRLLWVQGALHERRGSHLEARGRFSRAAELDPSLISARTRLAGSHLELGDAESALSVLNEVLASGQDTQQALELRARIWLGAGRAAEAERDLTRALELDPRDGSLRLRLAELAEATRRPGRALELYASALELTASESDRALALFRMARLKAGSGDLAAVESDLRRATGLDPGLVEAQLALGGLLLNQGRVDEAIEIFRLAGLHNPTAAAPRRAEAAALLVARRWDEATHRLHEALVSFPDDQALRATLARHLAACPDPEQRNGARALELAKSAVAHEASLANRETLAMALAESGDFAGAVRTQQVLIEELAGRAPARRPVLLANLARYRRSLPCCATSDAAAGSTDRSAEEVTAP